MSKVQLLPLKNQKAFDRISTGAVKYTCRFFIIIVSEIKDPQVNITSKVRKADKSEIYIGFKISKKYGKAHERNLLRRRIKTALLNFFNKNYYKLGIIVIPRALTKDLDYYYLDEQIIQSLNWSIKKLHL